MHEEQEVGASDAPAEDEQQRNNEVEEWRGILRRKASKWLRERFGRMLQDIEQIHQSPALLLGSGISRSFGMPMWSGLVSKMLGMALTAKILGTRVYTLLKQFNYKSRTKRPC